jgi:hypothetical protein
MGYSIMSPYYYSILTLVKGIARLRKITRSIAKAIWLARQALASGYHRRLELPIVYSKE